jgi:hypothetical protein
VPVVTHKYVEALPNLDYWAVGINPRWFVTFGDNFACGKGTRSNGAYKYITEKILCYDEWQQVGEGTMLVSVSLVYRLKGVPLQLNINEVRLQVLEGEALPAVLFASNFYHELAVENGTDRLSAVLHHIEDWRVDWDTYQDFLLNKFLSLAQKNRVLFIENASEIGLLTSRKLSA